MCHLSSAAGDEVEAVDLWGCRDHQSTSAPAAAVDLGMGGAGCRQSCFAASRNPGIWFQRLCSG